MIRPGKVTVLESPQQIWDKLIGKTVEAVAFDHYIPVRITCTDGSVFAVEPSGQPPSIYLRVVS